MVLVGGPDAQIRVQLEGCHAVALEQGLIVAVLARPAADRQVADQKTELGPRVEHPLFPGIGKVSLGIDGQIFVDARLLVLLEEMSGRKVAVLGDMLELGRYEQIGHQKIGVRAAEVADEIVTVGERARIISETARQYRFSAKAITELENTDEAIEYLRGHLGENDVVLVKGSRGMQLDRIVAALEARI